MTVYDWFVHHPRLKVVPGSKDTFEVDGYPARQLDLLPGDPVECAPAHTEPELRARRLRPGR